MLVNINDFRCRNLKQFFVIFIKKCTSQEQCFETVFQVSNLSNRQFRTAFRMWIEFFH